MRFADIILNLPGTEGLPTHVPFVKLHAVPPELPKIEKAEYSYDLADFDLFTADLHALEDLATRSRQNFMAMLDPRIQYEIRPKQDGIRYLIEAVPIGIYPPYGLLVHEWGRCIAAMVPTTEKPAKTCTVFGS